VINNGESISTPPPQEIARRDDPPATSHRVTRAVALGTALGLGVLACTHLYVRSTRRPGAAGVNAPVVASAYQTEEQWLLTQIARDISGMAALATGRDARHLTVTGEVGPTGLAKVTITPGDGPVLHETIRLAHSTWAPEDYTAFAERLLSSFGGRPVPAGVADDDEALLGRLLELRPEVIQREDEALSRALRERPADARLHDQAALLLGVFALREAPGTFEDTRHTLCRMTAHLSFARALSSSAPGVSGAFAEATLAALGARGAEATARLGALRGNTRGSLAQAAWLRILRLRNTQDWRELPAAEASLAERLEWLRAAESALDCERALQLLREAKAGPGPESDWALILSRNPTVGMGNSVLEYGLQATLAEADAVWGRAHGGTLGPDRRVAALNEPEANLVGQDELHVIGWGGWAAMYQREVLSLLEKTQVHYRHSVSARSEADGYVATQTASYSGLTLFPVLAACWEAERPKPDRRLLEAAIRVVVQRPELVNSPYWTGLQTKTAAQALPGRLPAASTWFSTGCVRGTAFDAAVRGKTLPQLAAESAMQALHSLAPDDYHVAYHLLSIPGSSLSVAQGESAFGERMQYDTRAMYWVTERAYVGDPAARLRIGNRMCQLGPGWCERVGQDCVEMGDEACAVVAYERMIEGASDRVMVSHLTGWLVKHYLRTGDRRRAREIAEMSADVGSDTGMTTMAAFLEQTGHFDGAERTLLSRRARYPHDEPDSDLIGFYHRMAHVRKLAAYEARFEVAAKDVFPRGVEKVDPGSLAGVPADGAVFTSESPAMVRNGVRKGDVVVAVDGWRVRSSGQYLTAREFDDDPDFRLIVWRDGKYVELPVRRLFRSFGTQMVDYVAHQK
jgi:hypothetical protein